MNLIIPILIQFTLSEQIKYLSVYPVQGEYLEMDLYQSIIEGRASYFYYYYPQVSFVTLVNAIEEIYSYQGQTFKSISSNESHFLAITTSNQVFMYQQQNEKIETQFSINAQNLGQCYNAIFSFQPDHYLMDCYINNQLMIIQFGKQTNLTYQNPLQLMQLPIKTSLKLYLQEKDYNFIIYAQYFQDYSILTLFSNELVNFTCWINQFIDFEVANQGSKLIYILQQQSILQVQISQDFQFEILCNSTSFSSYYNSFSIYYNYQYQAYCDQILVSINYNQIIEFIGVYGQISSQKVIYSMHKFPFNYLVFNQYFYIFQIYDTFQICTFDQELCYTQNLESKTALLYFNVISNKLYYFDTQIRVYQIAIPKLIINLTNHDGFNCNFDVFYIKDQLKSKPNKRKSEFNLAIHILNQNDTQVYASITNEEYKVFQKQTLQYNLDQQYSFSISGFSGQLLEYKVNSNYPNLGLIDNFTFKEIYQTKNFSLFQMLVINEKLYIIGYENQSLVLLTCTFVIEKQYSYNISCQNELQIPTLINATQLQIGLSSSNSFIAGLGNQFEISLFQITTNLNIQQYSISIQDGFSEFVILYNCVVVLTGNQEIQIKSYDQKISKILNQQSLNILFEKQISFTFQPTQIVTYQNAVSSVIFINNIYNVLIIEVNQQFSLIPISFINFTSQIFGINIVNQKIIISYICNDQNSICFEVWNIYNIQMPFYERNLPNVPYENSILLTSDNQFFYVTITNQGTLVYNPNLTQKMTLYKHLKDITSYLSSVVLQTNFLISKVEFSDKSLIFNENKIFMLQFYETFELQFNQAFDYKYYNLSGFPKFIFNFTVMSQLYNLSSQIKDKLQTPNETMIYISNFTLIPNVTQILTAPVSKQYIDFSSRQLQIPIGIFINEQILNCSIISNENPHNCQISNTQQIKSLNNTNSSNLITAVNNQFYVLQNQISIQIYDSNLTYLSHYDFSNKNFTNCLISTSQYNNLFSICQNSTNQYWVIFSLSISGIASLNNIQPLTMQFYYIQKYTRILNYTFILGSLYDSQDCSLLYFYDNQQNNFVQLAQDEYQSCVVDYDTHIVKNSSQKVIMSVFFLFCCYAGNMDTNTQINYQILRFNQTSLLVGQQDIFSFSGYKFSFINFTQIQVLQDFLLETLILVGSKNISLILYLTFDYQIAIEYQSAEGLYFQIDQIVDIIPQYGYLDLQIQTAYSNGILMMIYQQPNSNFTVAFYNISQINRFNQNQPTLMFQGQCNLNLTSQVMIIKAVEQKNQYLGTFLTIQNNQILLYPIDKQYLNCPIKIHGQTIHTNLTCINYYSNGKYQLKIEIPVLEQNKERWEIWLLLIICGLLIAFYFLIKYKLRNLQNLHSEIEL